MSAPAGWHADPQGRHQLRYWDGSAWTDHVSDGGDAGIDRLDGSTSAMDEVWAERVEDAPQDATTITPLAAASPRRSIWSRFRGLPVAGQALTAVLLVGALAASVGSGDPPAQVQAGAGSSESTVVRTSEVTSPPEPPSPPPTEAPTTTTTSPPATPPSTAPPTTTTAAPRPTTTAPTITAAPRPIATTPPTTAAPRPTTTAPAGGSCHPSYEGTCIPPDVSDADCAGGSGNGPFYVQEKNIRVVGRDVFDLDGNDNDGLGCET